MNVYLTYLQSAVTLRTEPVSHLVRWCSHWELIDEMARVGILRRVHHGAATYGDCSYYYL